MARLWPLRARLIGKIARPKLVDLGYVWYGRPLQSYDWDHSVCEACAAFLYAAAAVARKACAGRGTAHSSVEMGRLVYRVTLEGLR